MALILCFCFRAHIRASLWTEGSNLSAGNVSSMLFLHWLVPNLASMAAVQPAHCMAPVCFLFLSIVHLHLFFLISKHLDIFFCQVSPYTRKARFSKLNKSSSNLCPLDCFFLLLSELFLESSQKLRRVCQLFFFVETRATDQEVFFQEPFSTWEEASRIRFSAWLKDKPLESLKTQSVFFSMFKNTQRPYAIPKPRPSPKSPSYSRRSRQENWQSSFVLFKPTRCWSSSRERKSTATSRQVAGCATYQSSSSNTIPEIGLPKLRQHTRTCWSRAAKHACKLLAYKVVARFEAPTLIQTRIYIFSVLKGSWQSIKVINSKQFWKKLNEAEYSKKGYTSLRGKQKNCDDSSQVEKKNYF